MHISLFCEAIDKRFVYNLLSRNCQDFAFVSALRLIKKEDRSLVWGAVFGSGEHRGRILEKFPAMKTESRMVYAQILQQSGFNGFAAGNGDEGSSAPVDASGATEGDALTAFHMPTIRSDHHGGHL